MAHTLPLLDKRLLNENWKTQTWVVEAGRAALADVGYDTGLLNTLDMESPWRRALWEMRSFPAIVKALRPSVVLQFSNFAPRKLASPQVTVLRNAKYFTRPSASWRSRGIFQRMRHWLGRSVTARTLNNCNAVLCVSHSLEKLASPWAPGHEKLCVAQLGCDAGTHMQEIASLSREELLLDLSRRFPQIRRAIGNQTKVVVNVSNFSEHKNIPELLRAVERMQSFHYPVVAVITAGISLDGRFAVPLDRDMQRSVQRLVDQRRLIDLGNVDRPTMWRLLALADVFAFPSAVESFGHPLLEAQSMGVPVVASDTAVHREIAGDGASFYRLGDTGGLANTIAALLEDSEFAQRRIAAGRENVGRFSWHRHVEILADTILELVNKPSAVKTRR